MAVNGVDVNVETSTEPFKVEGAIEVKDFVFDEKREDFKRVAKLEIESLGRDLLEFALSEYDRRNA